MAYLIRFDYPDCAPFYAGEHKGALGWAPTQTTAIRFDTEEAAIRTAENGYGPHSAAHATIVEAEA